MKLNKVHNIDFLNNDLPDKCAKLIIADPPYYKVKGDFDFVWKTFDDYLIDVEKWAKECKRILADNGTLLWYGDAKNIAYSQIIFDKHFNLLNSVVWENTNQAKQSMVNVSGYRSFPPLTERILMYGNNEYENMKKYVESEVLKLGKFKHCDINKKLGFKTNGGSYSSDALNTKKINWKFPVKDIYIKFRELGIFEKDYDYFRRPFNNLHKLGDVIRLPNYETRDYEHDTIKPEDLTIKLITTCSRENDLVVVPFAGSGTECAMSAKEKRPFVGYEITEKHATMSQQRADKILKEPTLF
jgi:site-specific DNA-methyltransferase (adenine-specific)